MVAMLMSEGTHEGATAPGTDHHMAHMAMHGCLFVLSMVASVAMQAPARRLPTEPTRNRGDVLDFRENPCPPTGFRSRSR
ncbi:hypothetical protein [Nocardia terpenica]|uniref:Uncharacterized protein n=1 Tax=Nocardia terpenica TaxID=455432 RepID=A0A164HU41_9NOCA|nr:hypothetical protein [Nocardia terpenica]KZM68814.1 hypothetical protein AWN90_13555 [Nocardia terpenica]NQE88148.1 hypothetical protein [Nocardia terpenica]